MNINRQQVQRTAALLRGKPQQMIGVLVREAAPDVAGTPAADTQRPLTFRLSTEGEATDGHIVRQFWDLGRAETVNIPILWNHKRDAVLGRWVNFRVQEDPQFGRVLLGEADFDMEKPEAADLARQMRQGYVRGVSVRWIPGELVRRSELPKDDPLYRAPAEDECGQPAEGYIMGSERAPNVLLEASGVSVAADPSAYLVDGQREAAQDAELARAAGGLPFRREVVHDALASDPVVRTWLTRQIAEGVRSELQKLGITSTAQRDGTPAPPPPPPSTNSTTTDWWNFKKEKP